MTNIEILAKHALKNKIVTSQDVFSKNHNDDKYNWMLDAMNEALQKQQESDAVEFAEWLKKDGYIHRVQSNRSKNDYKKPMKALYQIFKSNNNGNND